MSTFLTQSSFVYPSNISVILYSINITADAVYFKQTEIELRLPGSAVTGDHVFDMNSVVVVDRENFVKSRLSFFTYPYPWYRYLYFYERCVCSRVLFEFVNTSLIVASIYVQCML